MEVLIRMPPSLQVARRPRVPPLAFWQEKDEPSLVLLLPVQVVMEFTWS
jgi:hypothetical protein